MILLFPSLIEFRSGVEKRKFDSTCHMFYANRVVDIRDGLPKWTGIDGKSELIEDSPVEAIEKRAKEIEEQKQERQ